MGIAKPIVLDGTTGEGGGQLVRIAVGLAALTTQPIKIINVRGNRPGARGGGLKSQHVTSIKWLAEVTDADTEGLEVGSHTLTFIPRRPPTALEQRHFKITAESGAASTLLVLQAMFPFLLFAANESGEPIYLDISGGTNVGFSLSFEYLDQILLPTLEERFGVLVERELKGRGWSLGRQSRGSIGIKLSPIQRGGKLNCKPAPPRNQEDSLDVAKVDVNIVTPMSTHANLQDAIARHLGSSYPRADVSFRTVEDSKDTARVYIFLVATSKSGIRWGSDILTSQPKKVRSLETWLEQISARLCDDLRKEVALGGEVDEHLQDQLICFQAMADGISSFPRTDEEMTPEERNKVAESFRDLSQGKPSRKDNTRNGPFGHGTLHTQTARWVVGELLPTTEFYQKGNIVKGVGISFDP